MNFKWLNVIALVGALAWMGCKSDPTPQPGPEETSPSVATGAGETTGAQKEEPAATPAAAADEAVATYGALRAIFHQGQTGSQVKLSSVADPHLHAVGALSESRGEITALDGTIWLASPDGEGGIRVEHAEQSDEEAMLLVTAKVESWRRVPIEEDIPRGSIDEKLEGLLEAHGVDMAQATPIRIEGPLENLEWHVLDGSKAGDKPVTSHADHQRMSIQGSVPQAEGTLVGFFSKQHHGVFTHMGSNSHLHVVLSEKGISGHVDGVDIKKGSVLLLPQ
ncbi:acetolactate decarboxylase [Haliangium sp.]|uniref:acetolactate decarboxylase n=1 Tax=Haliangium sp. TaxID=2663208 RepID=UPI003D10905A